MSNKRAQAGFSLIELVMAIVLIGVGVAGILTAYTVSVRNSADPLVHKQMLAVAEEMMEEILLKPYADNATDYPNPAAATCARDTWNDVLDYQGYDTSTLTCLAGGPATTPAIYDTAGNAISALSGYGVSVSMVNTTLPSTGGVLAKKITVTVSHGTERLQFIGWRSNYAG